MDPTVRANRGTTDGEGQRTSSFDRASGADRYRLRMPDTWRSFTAAKEDRMQTKWVAHLVVCGLLMAASSRADEEDFSQEDAKSAVQAYIDARVQRDGAFRYQDQQAEALLELQLDNIRLVRHIHGYGYFVDVDFHAKGEATKPYDLDFWLKPAGKKLEVVDVRIHKAPKREGDGWKLVTRSPIPWWWIPATEHPGETEEKKSWQVESAVNEYVAANAKDGVLVLKDDKTGETRTLDFVEIHRPLRRIEGGSYFACTDFREHGSKDKFYDIDFWLTEKDGQLAVTEARIHKEPKNVDGVWVQVPRYTFEKEKVKDLH